MLPTPCRPPSRLAASQRTAFGLPIRYAADSGAKAPRTAVAGSDADKRGSQRSVRFTLNDRAFNDRAFGGRLRQGREAPIAGESRCSSMRHKRHAQFSVRSAPVPVSCSATFGMRRAYVRELLQDVGVGLEAGGRTLILRQESDAVIDHVVSEDPAVGILCGLRRVET